MKPIILFMLLSSCILLHTACKKEITTPDEASESIFGKWDYSNNTGGFSGNGGSTIFGDDSWISFSDKGDFHKHEGSKVSGKSRFSIATNDSGGSLKYSVIFKQKKFSKKMELGYDYKVSGDTLYLSQRIKDGYLYIFTRK